MCALLLHLLKIANCCQELQYKWVKSHHCGKCKNITVNDVRTDFSWLTALSIGGVL